MWIGPELNNPRPGALLLVGRDPGEDEVRAGRPFVGKAGAVLDECLTEVGIRRQDVNIANVVGARPPANKFQAHRSEDVSRGLAELQALVDRIRPGRIVALGNEAAWALCEGWEGASIWRAKGIEAKRGYFYAPKVGDREVIATVHPAFVARTWVPWRQLLAYDLERAVEWLDRPLVRPVRDVRIVGSESDVRDAMRDLAGLTPLACDIENYDDQTLACVGFAPEPDRAWVFPADRLEVAKRYLLDPGVTKIWQNGQYDRYFLRTRCGIEVAGRHEDTLLQWHACYPELAGAATKRKGSKRTHKSLAFLASVFTVDAWWKDYGFETDTERFLLNGRDCCITMDVFGTLSKMVSDLGVGKVYEDELGSVPWCMKMLERGLPVDEPRRLERVEALGARLHEDLAKLRGLVLERLAEVVPDMPPAVKRLFWERQVCPCCRNGAGKLKACWSCAGFEKKPGKKALAESGRELAECRRCKGRGERTRVRYNPASEKQNKVVLYDVLKLPPRYEKGKLTTSESALRSLLGSLE